MMPGSPGYVFTRLAGSAVVVVLLLLLVFPTIAQADLTSSTPVTVDTGIGLTSVACPAVSQCTAVGSVDEVTFNPESPGSPTVTAIAPGARSPLVWRVRR